MEFIQLMEQIELCYEEVDVFKNFDLSVPKGQITSIIGPSGCGKTSLLNILADFVYPKAGRVMVEHEKIGYIFQEDRLLPWETVYNNIGLVREEEDQGHLLEILEALELLSFKDKYPSQLSGGMRQRCAVGRGFYYDSSLLLMDEPFKSLDYDLRLNMVKYFGKLWQQERNTVLFVTHDIDEALLLGHHIMVLSKRPTKTLKTYNITRPLEQRKISHKEHVAIRSEIIDLLSN